MKTTREIVYFENPELAKDPCEANRMRERNRKALAESVVGVSVIALRAPIAFELLEYSNEVNKISDATLPYCHISKVEEYENGAANLFVNQARHPDTPIAFIRVRPGDEEPEPRCRYNLDFGTDHDVTGACTVCLTKHPADFYACKKMACEVAECSKQENHPAETIADVKAYADRNEQFLCDHHVAILAKHERGRLVPVLVRCNGGRFTCPAQDAKHFIDIIEDHDHIRSVSLPANGQAFLRRAVLRHGTANKGTPQPGTVGTG
ncbi:MAG: hypothetical protein QGH15_20090, partial [Kiritimatiellia bacterium]|nr:hypothetical protein [Kiritimatiellia bacterium]